MLALTLAHVSYLTATPPHVSEHLLVNHLQPCILERGLILDSEYLGGGLVGAVLPYYATPRTSLDGQVPAPSQVMGSLPYLTDMFPNQELYLDILRTLSPHDFPETVDIEGVNVVWGLLQQLMNGAWNKWPLVYDPEGMVSTMGGDWETVKENKW